MSGGDTLTAVVPASSWPVLLLPVSGAACSRHAMPAPVRTRDAGSGTGSAPAGVLGK